jgi:hypothetical protein
MVCVEMSAACFFWSVDIMITHNHHDYPWRLRLPVDIVITRDHRCWRLISMQSCTFDCI